MNPDTLRERVETAIRQQIDDEAWERVQVGDRAVQESLDAYMAKWAKAKSISQLVQKYEGEG